MSFSFTDPFFSDFDRFFDDPFSSFDRWVRFPSSQRLLDQGQGQVEGQAQGESRSQSQVGFRPRVDIRETQNNEVTATFELPGLRKEDVNIDLHNNRLTISGETKFEEDKEENGWVVKERRRGKFSRSVPVPDGTKPNDVKANFENGVLSVTFPKVSGEQQPQRIDIN